MRRDTISLAAATTALGVLLSTAASAQQRPVAIQNARVLTMAGGVIESGTVLMRDGKIEAVGAKIVDAKGGTLMPGLVSAYSRAGLVAARGRTPQVTMRRGRRVFRGFSSRSSGGTARNQAAKKVVEGVYARQEIFGQLLECGITTLALTPSGAGIPGRGALLDPTGKTLEDLTEDDAAFVMVIPQPGTKNKKLLKDALEKAKKVVEERKKPPAPPAKKAAPKKAAAKKPDDKGGKKGSTPPEKKPPEKKPPVKKPPQGKGKSAKAAAGKKAASKPKPKPKDPNIEVLADLLEGKTRAVFEVSSAMQLVHFLDSIGDVKIPNKCLVAPRHSSNEGRLDEVMDRLKDWKKVPLLTSMALSSPRHTSAVVNPAAILAKEGFEIGFVLGESKAALRGLFFQLMDQVRHGMPAEKALMAVTVVPAKALGISDRVGTIAEGKDADVLLFGGDPLDPSSRLLRVWHKGRAVDKVDKAAAATGGTR